MNDIHVVYLKLPSIHSEITSVMESKAFTAVMYFFFLALCSKSTAGFLTLIVNASGQTFVAS